MPLKARLAYVAVYAAVILGTYKAVQVFLLEHRPTAYVVKLPGEEDIPFLPGMIVFYLSIYLFAPALVFFVERRRPFFRMLNMFAAATLLHAAFFVLVPVQCTIRPALDPRGTGFLPLVKMMYLLDAPYNCFPSMHVSFAFLTYFCVRAFRRELAKYYLIIAIGVSLSTLLVKQHYVADVAAAILLSWILSRLCLTAET